MVVKLTTVVGGGVVAIRFLAQVDGAGSFQRRKATPIDPIAK
jgi:hypothetical protein